MSETSPVLGLPYLQAAQAQKHVTHNEALRILDAVTQLSVLSADLATPPSDPSEGDRYIVATPGVDAWAGQDNMVAAWADNTWQFFAPLLGWRADIAPTGATLRFDGTTWQGAGDIASLPQLGISTSADSTNRLAVASDAALFSHDGAGHQIKVNKNAAGDTASLLFQTGWSGRAEMGTAGSDDFAIKVSPDGSAFLTALHVDATTGAVSFPSGGVRETLNAHRTYYVRIDGDDGNDGLSDVAGGAFRTIGKAVETMMELDCGTYDVTLQVGPGDYNEVVNIDGIVLGAGEYTVRGDVANPTSVKTRQFRCSKGAAVTIEGFELTSANGITTRSDAKVRVDEVFFSGPGSAISIQQSFVDCANSNLYFGNQVTSISVMYNYAYLSANTATLMLDAGINWATSGAFFVQGFCLVWLKQATFTGDTTGTLGKRFSVSINSAINTSGEADNFIPGSIDGTAVTGGLYI
ncbi:MAG: DUF2793 domain-containing protein [Pseudomonadota bacterium]